MNCSLPAIVVHSAYNGDEHIKKARVVGVHGSLQKSSTGDDLIPTIRTVAADGRWIPREEAGHLAVRR